MARSRNIKPSFFSNDELADLEPLARLLFVGLWTIADYKGDLEWREKRVKAQVLPYDNCCIESLAINLDKSGFIRFYSNGDKKYVHIVNFLKHQNPHKNERGKGSETPAYDGSMATAPATPEIEINHDESRSDHDENETAHADSFNLIPDSLSNKDTSESKIPPCPHVKIVSMYNEMLPELDSVLPSRWKGSARERNLNARWKEDKRHQSLEFWEAFFSKVRGSSWHMGENPRGWKANLGWLIVRGNFDKMVEQFFA